MTAIRTQEALAAEVVRRVSLCTVAQGAETDLGRKVYEGRRKVSDDMIPCTCVLDGDDASTVSGPMSTTYDTEQRFLLFAYVQCDPQNPNTAARQAIRDLKRAVFTTNGRADPTWGRSVRFVSYKGKDIGPRADGASFVLAVVEFTVQFVEDVASP